MTTGKAQGRKESGAEGCVPERDWGGRGCRHQRGKKVKESWKSLLFQEMAQIGREQMTAWLLTFHELHVTAAIGCKHRQSWSVFSRPPRHSSLRLLADNSHFPQLPFLKSREPPGLSSRLWALSMELAEMRHHRTEGRKDVLITSPKRISLIFVK